MASTVNKTAHPFSKANLDDLLLKRFFYAPAFEIYGGVAGLYDYGPPGSALQANIIAEWRKHFIIEESMLELDTTIMTPEKVFVASGHVAKFADWMVKDSKTGEVLRADHLVKNVLNDRLDRDKLARNPVADPKKKAKKETPLDDALVVEYESILNRLDEYSGVQLGELIKKHAIVNPATGNDVSDPVEFNLMFASNIGPVGNNTGYLRPETAQGHFVNFQRLLEFNNGSLPFASAQVGRSFRNEISPRNGLLRVREFTMAEIEHYVDPADKSHPRFKDVADVKLRFLRKEIQSAGKNDIIETTIGDAVATGMVANETLGYFVARIFQFLTKIGVDPARLRFRQHMDNEMAHYACDCWDAEILVSSGWVECVGCADRSAFDLTQHMKATGRSLIAQKPVDPPRFIHKTEPEWNRKELGLTFKKAATSVQKAVEALPTEELEKIRAATENEPYKLTLENGDVVDVTPKFVKIVDKTIKQTVEDYTPNVIEPSFGLGRILYALLEHSYWARESDINRGVLSLPPLVAPIKVLIVPISSQEAFKPLIHEIATKLRRAGIFSRVDASSVTIGKRYSRNDELGTPFGITVDFASVANGTVTLRERDTTDQRIGKVDEVIAVVADLVEGVCTWDEACGRLPAYSGVQAVDGAAPTS
ncbi:Putative glycine--tRNA ligase; AltName: Full=Diadenosine tetraphosphate synthetase; Short=AP-4-A synthetase; AltName: Full=Glycyl-tRNA synthetase; Short=GlyRS [Serendipita indica DSM 11827]|uniref:glycine--tRNA ligase n=1 Tax=Serendipita indica (strain DSM 11827) TaxID=1109443 RepID=G4TPH5_SERID|nr:Putative glycine--tRNA ligase; AltName: Full=Diadenosine tetraphosphate synthetase; Short=AP-4-A synthetase; AltName: Full=Glycyl-tRNA synthetase; Short=GlyRS [Serendipita indica DSM 11827]CCA73218.1 probable glycine--tRNA ligase GRS1 [Serendipita indica DSM 11827]